MPKGEKVLAQSKRTAPDRTTTFIFKKSFSNWYLTISKKGEKVAPSKIGILKPS
jgi:hypothetical protein